MKFDFKKNAFAILGIIVGIWAAGIGFMLLNENVYCYAPEMTFGADFYTEIVNSVQDVRERIADVNDEILRVSGWFLVFFGLTDICAFGCFISNNTVCEKRNEILTMEEN